MVEHFDKASMHTHLKKSFYLSSRPFFIITSFVFTHLKFVQQSLFAAN